jgi:hypothetical protein
LRIRYPNGYEYEYEMNLIPMMDMSMKIRMSITLYDIYVMSKPVKNSPLTSLLVAKQYHMLAASGDLEVK